MERGGVSAHGDAGRCVLVAMASGGRDLGTESWLGLQRFSSPHHSTTAVAVLDAEASEI